MAAATSVVALRAQPRLTTAWSRLPTACAPASLPLPAAAHAGVGAMMRVASAVLALSVVLAGTPAVAFADSGNPAVLIVLFVLAPALIVFLPICIAIWRLVPRSYRPLAMAIWFVPISPVHNGFYPWPLFVYLCDPEDVTARAVLISAVLTAGVVYGASYWLGQRRP